MQILQQIQRICEPSIAETQKARSLARERPWNVNLTWILLGTLCWGLALLFLVLLMRMVRDQYRAARHEQERIDPLADVTLTRTEERTGG